MMHENHILRSPYPDPDFPVTDLYTYLINSEGFKHPDKLAVVNTEGNHLRMTFRELEDAFERAAGFLQTRLGFCRDRKLALYCPNQLEFVVILLAAWKLGGTVVCMNHQLGKDEILYELELTSTKLVFCGQEQAKHVAAVKEELKLEAVIVCGQYSDFIPMSDVMSYHQKSVHIPENLAFDPKTQTAAILFSSGTTGKPKGVESTHYNVIAGVMTRNAPHIVVPTPHIVTFQPLSHTIGMFVTISMLRDATTSWFMPRYDMRKFLEHVTKLKVTALQLVPPIAVQMIKNGDVLKRFDLSCVKDIKIAGARLPSSVESGILKYFPHIKYVRQGYGLTETSGGVTITPRHDNLHVPLERIVGQNQIGQIQPGVEIKIVDVDTGKSLGPHLVGEICIRSQLVVKGYYGNPEATASCMDKDRFFHTGDTGYYDEDEIMHIVDRIKDVIKYKGLQVAPVELEDILLRHPEVADVAVVGKPELEAGELPTAFVVRRQGSSLTQGEVQTYISNRVAPFKRLRGGVQFIDVVPKSSTGKVLRRILRDRLRAQEGASKL